MCHTVISLYMWFTNHLWSGWTWTHSDTTPQHNMAGLCYNCYLEFESVWESQLVYGPWLLALVTLFFKNRCAGLDTIGWVFKAKILILVSFLQISLRIPCWSRIWARRGIPAAPTGFIFVCRGGTTGLLISTRDSVLFWLMNSPGQVAQTLPSRYVFKQPRWTDQAFLGCASQWLSFWQH